MIRFVIDVFKRNKRQFFVLSSFAVFLGTPAFSEISNSLSALTISQSDNEFRQGIRVCNDALGSGTIYMAIAIYGRSESRIVGWFRANEGECTILVNNIESQTAYHLHAFSKDNDGLSWQGYYDICIPPIEGLNIQTVSPHAGCQRRLFYTLDTTNRRQLTEYLQGFEET